MVFKEEKKDEKGFDDFWRRKLILNVKFWHILTPPHYNNSQNSIIFFGCRFLGENLSNFVSPDLKLHNRYCHNGNGSKGVPCTMGLYTFHGKILLHFDNFVSTIYFHIIISKSFKSESPEGWSYVWPHQKSRSVCVKQALNTRCWLVNALVTWHAS